MVRIVSFGQVIRYALAPSHYERTSMSQSSTPAVADAIYDASSLGRPRMFLLGLQHLFAMFGATVLVPVLTGLRFRQRFCLSAWARCFPLPIAR